MMCSSGGESQTSSDVSQSSSAAAAAAAAADVQAHSSVVSVMSSIFTSATELLQQAAHRCHGNHLPHSFPFVYQLLLLNVTT